MCETQVILMLDAWYINTSKHAPLVHFPLQLWAERRCPLIANYTHTHTQKNKTWVQETSFFGKNINTQKKGTRPDEWVTHRTNIMWIIYLGVRISLYCSFSTRVVAATDMGITMLLMSKELSPRLLLMGCCWGTNTVWGVNIRLR